MTAPLDTDASLQQAVELFENLTPQRVAELDRIYTGDAFFKDPFNEFNGIDRIQHVFSHMFVALNEPRFEVTSRFAQGAEGFIAWNFIFRFKDTRPEQWQCIRGSTHLKFAADGRIAYHRDYWDAAEELYEKIPLLGSFMRWIKKKAGG
jgi:steroid delta-isomerase